MVYKDRKYFKIYLSMTLFTEANFKLISFKVKVEKHNEYS